MPRVAILDDYAGMALRLADWSLVDDRAIEALNGSQLDGRSLTVNEARPREARPSGGG